MIVEELYEALAKIMLDVEFGNELPVKFLNSKGTLDDVTSFEIIEDSEEGRYLQLTQ
jgi:hypothetical protein